MMKPTKRSAAAAAAILASTGLARAQAHEALIIVNPNDAESLYVSNYYANARGVPSTGLTYFDPDPTGYADFIATRVPAVLGTIANHRNQESIDYLVLPAGTHYRMSASGFVSDGCFPVNLFSTTGAYTTTRFASVVQGGVSSLLSNGYFSGDGEAREFDNGTKRVATPLVSVVGASNELPKGEELDALFDRFLLRLHVGFVSGAGFDDLLALRGQVEPEVPEDWRLSVHELAKLRRRAEAVEVPGDVVALLKALREWCAAEQIFVSDRRWRKIVKLLQVSALTNGRSQVSVWDCWLLQHCVWSAPEEREKVFDWYAARVGAAEAMNPDRLTRIVVKWEAQLEKDQESRSQAQDTKGRLLYVTAEGRETINSKGAVALSRDNQPLYLAPPESRIYRSYDAEVVEDRTNQGRGFTRAELDEHLRIVVSERWKTFQQWPERDAYLANPNNRLIGTGKYSPKIEPTRFKSIYIDGCLRQLSEFRATVSDYADHLRGHIAGLEAELRSHLWVTEDFIEPAANSLKQTDEVVESLLARLDRVSREFNLLPRELEIDPEDAS